MSMAEVVILVVGLTVPAIIVISFTYALYKDSRDRGNGIPKSLLFGALGPIVAVLAMLLLSLGTAFTPWG